MIQPPVDYIARTKAQYDALGYASYSWVENPNAGRLAALRKPVAESKLGLISSGGVYRHGQIAFHYKDDLSFREIPSETPVEALRATHFAYDLTDARKDPNVVFPLETLRRCVELGKLGALGEHAYTFMGGIYSSRRVRDILAPALADRLQADAVDAALLVPV